MKTAFTLLKLITIFCCAFAALAVMGQTTYTWVGLLGTNGTPDGTNIANAANWSPSGGPPSGSTGDTAQWNGTVPGNLTITYASGLPGTGGGTSGINLNLTASQTGNVSIVPVGGATANAGVHNINITGGAGQFALGDDNDSVNILNIVSRPSGATLDFVNDSTNAAIIYPNVRWQAGGGEVYELRFDGSGNWCVTNSLATAGGPGILVSKYGSGTVYWNGPSVNNAAPNAGINSPITINGGKMVLEWSNPLFASDAFTVADGATLGVYAAGPQITPPTLTLGTSAGAALEFNNVNNITTAPIAVGTLSAAGTLTINVNSGTFTAGLSYPLLTWTNGSAPAVSLGILNGALGNLSTNGNTIQLNVTQIMLVWSGANNDNWDTTTTNNWLLAGAPVTYSNPAPVLFDDTATGTTTVTVNALVQPTSVIVNNSARTYTIASSFEDNIGGNASFTKDGNGTLTMTGGFNTYTGVTTVNGGILSVTQLGSPSDIGAAGNSATNLVLDGGTLEFAGTPPSPFGPIPIFEYVLRLFTVGTSGGTIDVSAYYALYFGNTGAVGLSGAGPRVLTLTCVQTTVPDVFAPSLADYGGPTSLVKNGAGTWVLTGTNSYSGGTTVAEGELVVGMGGASGTLGSGAVTDDGSLDFDVTNTLTVTNISGTGSVTNDGNGTVILSGNNGYSGGTTIKAGTLQIGNGGASGTLGGNYVNNTVTDDSILVFDRSGNITVSNTITGTGNVEQLGSGSVTLTGANTYTGTNTVSNGTLAINGSDSASNTLVVAGTFGGDGTLTGPVSATTGTTLAPGAMPGTSIGTLTINTSGNTNDSGGLSFSGNLVFAVNKSLTQSNSLVVVMGTLINMASGTLTVTNLGPALAVGDTFTLFSEPVQNGAALTVTGGGANWANNLGVNGSITVTSLVSPTLNFAPGGKNSLEFSWTGSDILQVQTNGLNGVWFDYPSGGASPVSIPINPTNSVFFRLAPAP